MREIFVLNKVLNGVHFDVCFEDKFCVLPSDSGVGKTFLMQSLYGDADEGTMLYVSFLSYELLFNAIDNISNYNLVLLDNADLYLSDELLLKFRDRCNHIVISARNFLDFGISDYKWYDLDFHDNALKCRRKSRW